MRKQVNHWFLLSRNPLALVQVVIILWNTSCIYDTKVRTLNWSLVLVVPWSRLTYIVGTRPDELTCITCIVTVKSPRCCGCFTPTNTVITVVWLLIMTVSLIAVDQFTFWSEITSTCTSSWGSFRTVNQPIWMFRTKFLVVVFWIVKSNRIKFIGNLFMVTTTITKAELICSHSDIACLINSLNNLNQAFNCC